MSAAATTTSINWDACEYGTATNCGGNYYSDYTTATYPTSDYYADVYPTSTYSVSVPADAVVTNVLLFDTDYQQIAATVIDANPTAVTYELNCFPGVDSADCGLYNYTITEAGAWASPSPAPTATGTYDMSLIDQEGSESYLYSIHCSMSNINPVVCTTINADSEEGTTTAIVTAPSSDGYDMAWSYLPITVISGQDKLANAASNTATTTPASSSANATGASSSAGSNSGSTLATSTATGTKATGSASGSATGSSTGAPAQQTTSGASRTISLTGAALGALVLSCLLL